MAPLKRTIWGTLAILSLLLPPAAQCQDASSTAADSGSSSASTDSGSSSAPADTGSSSAGAAGGGQSNPMEGLFTPQPQYPTPQSHENPQPNPSGSNPVGGLFNVQPQYPNAQNPGYTVPQTPQGDNPLKGLFTGQPQYPTGETKMNPEPQPKNPYTPPAAAGASGAKGPGGDQAAAAGGSDKAASADKPKETAKEGDKDKKAEGDKDKDKDKDKTAEGKDKDKDKDKEKTAEEKEKEKEKAAEKKLKKEEDKIAKEQYNPVKAAIVLMNSGSYQDALSTLAGVLKSNPRNVQAHYVKAVVLVAIRDYANAAEEYRAVLNLVPTSSLAQLAAEGLRKIGGAPPATPKLPPLQPVMRSGS